MVWPAVIAAGAALAGGAMSAQGAANQNKAAKAESERMREFSRSMYEHRYQWQMEDMRKAGLNPILAYKTGAPGGPGSAGGYSPVNVGAGAGSGVMNAVNSAIAARRQHEELQNMQAQRKLIQTQIDARAGDVAAAKNKARANAGDKGYVYWLLQNSNALGRAASVVPGLSNAGSSAKSSARKPAISAPGAPGRTQKKKSNPLGRVRHGRVLSWKQKMYRRLEPQYKKRDKRNPYGFQGTRKIP